MTEPRSGYFPGALPETYADEATQPFWDAALAGRLAAPRCTNCGTVRLPPGPFCFECQHQDVEWIDLPGTGTVYSFTVVRHPLRPDLQAVVPYVSAVVDLDGTQGAGARLIANVVECDPESVAIGDKVRIEFDTTGGGAPVPRFRPA
jgi:hypothetical protein